MDSCVFCNTCYPNSTRRFNNLLPAQPSPHKLVTNAAHHKENHHYCSPFRPRCPWHSESSPLCWLQTAPRITALLYMQSHVLLVWFWVILKNDNNNMDKLKKIATFIEMCNVKYLALIMWHHHLKIPSFVTLKYISYWKRGHHKMHLKWQFYSLPKVYL